MPGQSLQISYSLPDIRQAAHQLWQWAHPARVFIFSGSLGAGKTTFIHAICDVIGVQDVVSSPTFALVNEYQFEDEQGLQTIQHMDWYRLRDADEAIDAGMEDALHQQGVYCFVEWPEKADELLTMPFVRIRLEATDDTLRSLSAEKC